MIMAADDVALAECRVFCNSAVIRERLRLFNEIDAEVLYPPLDPAGGYNPGVPGDTIVFPSRIVFHKRQLLAVEALAHTQTPVGLELLGAPDDPGSPMLHQIAEVIDQFDLRDRCTVSSGWVDEELKRQRIAAALAVAYLPIDEDSYGYPSLEAAACGRPVVTTCDSGGVLELVRDGENGLVVEPTPQALADAFDRLYLDRALADSLGRGQAQRVAELQINWDHVVERLLA